MKKLFTLFLALAASVGTMYAESGTCGSNLSWDLTNGVMTISGSGTMDDFSYPDYAPWFSNRMNILQVVINSGVTSIGNSAFCYCSNMTSVTIPNSVTSIGEDAFYNCTSLPVTNNLRYAGTYLVGAADKTLSTYTITEGTKWIGSSAFYGCSGLTSVTIPNSVTSIGNFAFYGCDQLESITIPQSVTSIGYNAFYNCTGITAVETPAIFFNEAYSIFGLSDTEMPSHIKNITISSGELTSEGLDRIRVSYRELETIDLARASNMELPDMALNGCYKLQTISLPHHLEKIGYMSVAECVKLQEITIPATITEIEDRAFENCRSLKTITFGGQASSAPGRFGKASSSSQLKRIGNWAFYNCHELQNLEIPEGVTEIGDGAFYGCTYLEGLSLPASVQTIGDNTFALCAKLQKIVVNAPVPPSIQAKTFYNVKRQIPVYVPDESVDAYKNDAQWSEFDIQGISNMPIAIDNISVTIDKTIKFLRDGKVFILRGNKTYTTMGQEVR